MNIPSSSTIVIADSQFTSPPSSRQAEIIIRKKAITYPDKVLVEGLKNRDINVIKYLYKKFYREIFVMVSSNSGSKMDAEDIFHDALIILYQKISQDNLKFSCSFNTYLFSVCRHLWLQKLNKKLKMCELTPSAEQDVWEDGHDLKEHLKESEKYSLFCQHFCKLSPDEQKVLKLYMNKTPAREIAEIMGYKSDKYAKFRKYLCKEKLKNSIMNDPRFQQIYQSS